MRSSSIPQNIKANSNFLFSHTRYRQRKLPLPLLNLDYGIYLWQPVSRVFRIVLAYGTELIKNRRIQDPYRNDYFERELLHSGCAMVTLVQKRGFYRRFVKAKTDPLKYLIKIQKKIERPIYIVPQLIFYGKKPSPAVPTLPDMLFGTSQRPGIIRKVITLVRHPGKIFVELSQPLNLQQWTNQASSKLKNLSPYRPWNCAAFCWSSTIAIAIVSPAPC
jgi:glycerol-3-phosphate O-acyltransferase